MKKVLVIVDCQNDFITGSLANEEAQKKVPNIVKKINEFDGDCIILTRDTHDEDYLATKEGEKLPVVHCVKDTWGWEIEKSVANAFTERINDGTKVVGTIVDKPTFGSFDLIRSVDFILDAYGDNDIEICGFCTDICVVSNALLLKAALYNKANITVDAACSAGVTIDSHNAALTTMSMCQINIVNE